VEPGDRIAVLGPTTLVLVETLLATWLSGATVVVLPLPLRLGSQASFAESTRARLVEAGAVVAIVDDEYLGLTGAYPAGMRVERLVAEPPSSRTAEPFPVDADASAILQFTSGSTARPKVVQLSHRAVTANLRAILDAVGGRPSDRAVSWLPLYHDMGLIGLLLCPMVSGIDTTFIPTGVFMQKPGLWMRTISDQRATLTAGPNFAYGLAARLLARTRDIDLSTLRVALCGAEPVVASTLAEFGDRGAPHGLRPRVAVPCYGLAEATLAVTIAPVDRALSVDVVDRADLADRRVARPATGNEAAVEHVALGLPLRGTAVRVVGPVQTPLGEREVGELQVASPSLMDGYLDEPLPTLVEGWLPTGDLGYVADGEVYICGRVKDLIIVNGQNIHPHQVEAVAETVDGVRMGGAVAFSVDDEGRESIVVLCESRASGDRRETLAAEVRRRVAEAVGVAPRYVGLVHPKRIPKTSSGKVQRQRARALFLDGDLDGAEPLGDRA
jgi:fatty-acyl-CoA synthase